MCMVGFIRNEMNFTSKGELLYGQCKPHALVT